MNNWRQILSWKIQSDEFYNFEKVLQDKNISYHLDNDIFIIDHESHVSLNSLESLPSNIIFNNQGNIGLDSLKFLPDNIIFNNQGNVILYSLKFLPNNAQFNNQGNVNLPFLKSLPDNKYEIFKNNGIVYYNYGMKFDPRIKEE